MLIFTSINNGYLPKARVLAQSVHEYMPEAEFVLVLSDKLPGDVDPAGEPFDRILYPEDLDIPVEHLDAWIFKHTVVELCTAVKGPALVKFLSEGQNKVMYMDPDTRLYRSIQPVFDLLDEHPVVLTPHMTAYNKDLELIWETEVSCLKHGCYNLGYLAVNNDAQGREFAEWWRDRLVALCYEDIENGIFTDQRWVDLAPCFFDFVYILRDSNYNVATWNISNRKFSFDENGTPMVDGKPLVFYHFSGYDNGTDDYMTKKYQGNNEDLKKFRAEYFETLGKNGRQRFKGMKGAYDFYDDGTPVERKQRVVYRRDPQLEGTFPHPYESKGYLQWYLENSPDVDETDRLKKEIVALNDTIQEIYASRTWKLASKMARVGGKVKGKKDN